MELGGEALEIMLKEGQWAAYRKTEKIPYEDLKDRIGPNSIDVTLNHWLKIPRMDVGVKAVDIKNPESLAWLPIALNEKGYVLQPGACVLGAVNERFDCDSAIYVNERDEVDMSLEGITGEAELPTRPTYWKPDVDGRSTVGRLFVQVHMTAGFGDYGFKGAFTLEIRNSFEYPVILYPGMRIAQVSFKQILAPKKYHGAYSVESHYDGPCAPLLGRDRFF